MSELNQLKNMIDLLVKQRIGLKNNINEFNQLKEEIKKLYDSAAFDTKSADKLKKLNKIMNENAGVTQEIYKKSVKVKKSFEQLSRQLNQIHPEIQKERKQASIKKEITKKHNRSFI